MPIKRTVSSKWHQRVCEDERFFFDLIAGRCDQDSPQRHGAGEETQGQQPGRRTAHRVPQGNPAPFWKNNKPSFSFRTGVQLKKILLSNL